MADLLVYALGDSLMWGEGLAHERKFAVLATASLAQARGLEPKLHLLAHTGAKLKATREERKRFANLFPHLFTGDERDAFIGPASAGPDFVPDERPANRLHGEIPRAFPTIHHQLRSIPDADAVRVDVLLLTGGANDLDFETVFTTGGDFLKALDADYRRIFHDDVLELITAARQRCPNAQIVFTGYYSAFSPASNFGGMKNLFLELSDKRAAYEVLSTIRVVGLLAGAFVVAFIADLILDNADDKIEAAVALARATSEASESRAGFWMRRAITEINEEPAHATIRGPGVILASPGFRPENCMFAQSSLIWQQFEAEDLDDDMRAQRAQACPRNSLRGKMKGLRDIVFLHPPPPNLAQQVINLHNALDGPVALRQALNELLDNMFDNDMKKSIIKLLNDEIDRIDLTRISSLIHPNREGASRYARMIHKRAEEIREVSLRQRLLDFLPPTQRKTPPAVIEVGKTIRRFGFDPAVGLKACLAHAEPDVLGLVVHTHLTSDLLSREVILDLGDDRRRKLRHLLTRDLTGDLELNPHLQPGTRDFFTIDVAGQMRIGDITQLVIDIGQDNGEAKWRPESVTFSIDGRDVHTVTALPEVTRSLDLHFPA